MPRAYFPLGVMVADTHLDVLGDTRAFLLGDTGHDRGQDFALAVRCQNVLLLEQNAYPLCLQLSDVLEAVQRVAGETRDAFGNDHLYFARHAVRDHAVEFGTLGCSRPAQSFVGVNACQGPFGVTFDVSLIMAALGFVVMPFSTPSSNTGIAWHIFSFTCREQPQE